MAVGVVGVVVSVIDLLYWTIRNFVYRCVLSRVSGGSSQLVPIERTSTLGDSDSSSDFSIGSMSSTVSSSAGTPDHLSMQVGPSFFGV